MKSLRLLPLLIILIISCDKPVESDTQFTDLSFTKTVTPSSVALNQDIVTSVSVMGPNLCYHFAFFTVNQQQFLIDIHAIGTYPAKPTSCLDMLYGKDTSLSIPTNVAGRYVLRFYNGTQLFKGDTVQVN